MSTWMVCAPATSERKRHSTANVKTARRFFKGTISPVSSRTSLCHPERSEGPPKCKRYRMCCRELLPRTQTNCRHPESSAGSAVSRIAKVRRRQPAQTLLIPALHKLRNRTVSLRQRRLIRQKDNPKMLCPRLLPKPRAVNHHHMLLQDQFLHEHIIALGNIDAGIRVESPTRRNATHPRRGIAP